jgi:hypothetical protein
MLGKAATVATYGFSRGNTNSPSSIVLRNNIFDISRTGGSGSHIAVANISSTYANWNAGTSNYNILNVPNASEVAQHIGSGSLLSFSSWKDSSGCDANSIADHAVSFVNSSSDLHLAGSSRGDKQLTGTPLSGYTTDVDGDVRHSLYPYIGADEVTTSPLALQLTLTALPEGFYDGTSLIPDTLNIQLCKGTAPYNVIDSIQVLPNDAGISSSYFRGNSKSDSSYYIVIKHRNSIETWSGTPALFTNGIAIFNITTSASQAYGNNLVLKAGRYCIYSGDVNQDGIVDFSDLVAIDNDQFTFVGGYVVTDITGDQFVDFSDLSLCDNNQFNFISVAKPGLKRVQKPAHSRISSQQIY